MRIRKTRTRLVEPVKRVVGSGKVRKHSKGDKPLLRQKKKKLREPGKGSTIDFEA